MKKIRFTLTKDEYETLLTMNHYEQYKELENNILPMVYICGYGFYGCGEPQQEDNNYFIEIEIGNSCD